MCGIAGVVRHGGEVAADAATTLDAALAPRPRWPRRPMALRWKRRLDPVAPAIGAAVTTALPERLTERWHHFMSGNGRIDAAFTLPFAQWIEGELQPFVRAGMAHLAESGWIAPGAPDATWRAASGRGALEPPMGARAARRVPAAAVMRLELRGR